MPKLSKKNTPSNIQTYNVDFDSISDVFDFIDNWLPRNYTTSVLNLMPEEYKVDPSYIRQVKRERIHNPKIINALYRLSQFNKLQLQRS